MFPLYIYSKLSCYLIIIIHFTIFKYLDISSLLGDGLKKFADIFILQSLFIYTIVVLWWVLGVYFRMVVDDDDLEDIGDLLLLFSGRPSQYDIL